jgi:hypothetical protein
MTIMKSSDEIVEKVRGLLRLAADQTSPHEAATALRHAKKLMDKYELEESMVAEKTPDELHREPMFNWSYKNSARAPVWLSSLCVAITKLFDCEAGWSYGVINNKTGYYVEVFGLKYDVKVAVMTLRYILDQLDGMFEKFKGGGSLTRAQGVSWYSGAVGVVTSRIREFKKELEASRLSMGTALVVIKSAKIKESFGEFGYTQRDMSETSAMNDMSAFLSGAAKGGDVNLTNLIEN